MARQTRTDEDDPDTGSVIREEFTRRFTAAELQGSLDDAATVVRPPPKGGDAEAWMEEALKNSATVVRKLDDQETVLRHDRAELDELPGPSRRPAPKRGKAPVLPTRLAPAPAAKQATVTAQVRLDPSADDAPPPAKADETENTASRALPAQDPGWAAVQASLAGLAASAVIGMLVLTGFWVLR